MNLKEEVYFELGKLNLHLKLAKKQYFLLPMIVRQGVIALNAKGAVIDFSTLFSPNVAENPSKETMQIVKQIKTINDFSASNNFDLQSVKTIVKAFEKQADVSRLDNIEWNDDLSCLYSVVKELMANKTPQSILSCSIVVNLFLMKAKFIDFPMLDVAKSIKEKEVQSIEDFYNLMIASISSTIRIIEEHKKLIKADAKKAESAKMKSVSLEYNYLIENPVVEIGSMLEDLEMTFATLSKATAILEKLGILEKISGSQRYRIFKYNALCQLFGE